MEMSKSDTLNKFSSVSLLFLLVTTAQALRPYHFAHHSKSTNRGVHVKEGELGMELYPTGSSLPDCAHACGPCSPCRRVIVSYNKCSVESCPIVYRCMCRGKYYHVPSN